MPEILYYVEITERQPIVVEIVPQVNSILIEVKDSDQYQLIVSDPIVYSVEISEKVAINNVYNDIDNLSVIIPCDSSVFVGAAVYLQISGASVKAYNAKADNMATSNVFGICESKPSSTTAKIRFGGKTSEIFVGLDLTKEYYLSDVAAGMIVDEDNLPTGVGSILVKLGQPFTPSSFVYVRGGKEIVTGVVAASGLTAFGFTGDMVIDTGIRTNDDDIIDHGLRFA